MKTLLFVALLCTCVPALAGISADPLITSTTVTAEGVSLTLANLEQERTVVLITHYKSGEQYHRETIKRHNGFSARFDLSALADGRYVITVEKGNTVRKQVILKEGDTVRCSDWS